MVLDQPVRREQLARALWRVVSRDGLERASVRNVAREAGLSAGSLRHVFPTQGALLTFAMELVIARVRQRTARRASRGEPLEGVLDLLEQLLPLDDERAVEAQVWFAFSARALVDPALAEVRRRGFDVLRGAATLAVRALASSGRLGADRDPGAEAERLHALLDGLTVHVLLRPEVVTADAARRILHAHVTGLATPLGTEGPAG